MDKHILDDFPVDWQEDQYVSRREFVKFLTLASGGMAVSSIGLAVWEKFPRSHVSFDVIAIAKTDQIPVGGWLQFAYPRPTDACLLVHTGVDQYVAYSRRCTHLSCPVIWQEHENRLYCPCHNGAFSIDDGHVLQGPPARPLPKVQLSVENGTIYATGVTNESI